MAARIASHYRLVIVCRRDENSKISTLLSTKTSYNDDIRRQQDEHRSDVQKSKQDKNSKSVKTLKSHKNSSVCGSHKRRHLLSSTVFVQC